jgi:type I restriction enzyme S subunit
MKRYDSYKDSGVKWIGEIPTNWKSKRFSYSIDIQKGKIPKNLTDKKLVDSLPYLSMGVLRGDEPLEFSNESGVVYVSKGDIGLLWDGSNSGEVIRINREGILSSTVSLLSLKDDSIDKEFSFYLLKFYENDFRENTIGMGIPHVSGDHVRESKLIIPPLSEQQQIVSFLDTKTSLVDSLIEKTQRKIELLKEKRTSLINEVVTKGLNPNVEMKDIDVEWIGDIPSSWFISKVKFISKVYGRIGFRGYKTTDLVEEGEGVITLSPSNIYEGKLVLNKKTYLSYEKYYESPEIIIKSDDIVYVQRGSTIGKSTIIPKEHPEMTINPQLIIIKDHKSSPRLTYYLMNSKLISIQTQNELNGGSTPMISQNSVENFIIPISKSIDEQQQIVEYLDEQTQLIDNTTSIEEKRIELLKEYRQSLISEVVTGKRKVV